MMEIADSTAFKWTFIYFLAYLLKLTNECPCTRSRSLGLYMVVKRDMCHKSRAQLAVHGRNSWQRFSLTWLDGSVHKVQIVGPVITITDHHVHGAMTRCKEWQLHLQL